MAEMVTMVLAFCMLRTPGFLPTHASCHRMNTTREETCRAISAAPMTDAEKTNEQLG